MKKNKFLLPLLISTTIAPAITTITSCSTESLTVVLYASEGKFGNNGQILMLTDVGNNTKLSDIAKYVQPTLSGMEFAGWTDENGAYIPEDTLVTKSLILRANYEEPADAPDDFLNDTWPTVLNVMDQGYVKFAKTYCGYEGKTEEGALFAIQMWIAHGLESDSPESFNGFKRINLRCNNTEFTAVVHLIDVDHDTIYGTNEKAKFTFEFYDIIDACLYNNDGDKVWYDLSSDGTVKQAFLRKYLNENVFNYLPMCIRRAIKTVDKQSPSLKFDFINETVDVELKHSPEKLFPLSMFENNTWILANFYWNINNGLVDTYWYYDVAIAQLEAPILAFVKPIVETYYEPLSLNGLYCDYWSRTASVEVTTEPTEWVELANALAVYINSVIEPSQVVLCPAAPTDIGVGVSPAFCI